MEIISAESHDLPAVRRKPLKEEIYDVLHEHILAGEYPAGSWLRQEEIASKLGVSMTPVREALDLLVSAGLAERVPFRGVRIQSPSDSAILNSYAMRLLLETAATYAAAINITCEQLSDLLQMLEKGKVLVGLEDMPQERALSRDLHSTIVAASGNPLLHKTYLTVLNTFPDWMLYEHLYRQPELLEESIRSEYTEHRLIVEALSAHDPELAAQRAMEHVTNRGRELETYLGISSDTLRATEAQIIPMITKSNLQYKQLEKELP